MTNIFIDGSSGTTGLQIWERLSARTDIHLIEVPYEERHSEAVRKDAINSADIAFLCLPDDAAEVSASLVENEHTVVIDTSTKHRTAPGWVYGLPELEDQREKIISSRRIANPGCHATGFLSVTAPLVRMGILPVDYPVACYSLTGYSGGGKKMIAQYEAEDKETKLAAPGIYGLTLKHKHLPEMLTYSGLQFPPVFHPVVDDYYKGMATSILLQNRLLNGTPSAEEICKRLAEYYQKEHFVTVRPFVSAPSTIYAASLAGTNRLEIIVCGNEEQTTVTALFDNLGKGASGAAVQNMNIMLGMDETTGLE